MTDPATDRRVSPDRRLEEILSHFVRLRGLDGQQFQLVHDRPVEVNEPIERSHERIGGAADREGCGSVRVGLCGRSDGVPPVHSEERMLRLARVDGHWVLPDHHGGREGANLDHVARNRRCASRSREAGVRLHLADRVARVDRLEPWRGHTGGGLGHAVRGVARSAAANHGIVSRYVIHHVDRDVRIASGRRRRQVGVGEAAKQDDVPPQVLHVWNVFQRSRDCRCTDETVFHRGVARAGHSTQNHIARGVILDGAGVEHIRVRRGHGEPGATNRGAEGPIDAIHRCNRSLCECSRAEIEGETLVDGHRNATGRIRGVRESGRDTGSARLGDQQLIRAKGRVHPRCGDIERRATSAERGGASPGARVGRYGRVLQLDDEADAGGAGRRHHGDEHFARLVRDIAVGLVDHEPRLFDAEHPADRSGCCHHQR